jgi:hypothetical protein
MFFRKGSRRHVLLLIFWLVRIRFANAYGRRPIQVASASRIKVAGFFCLPCRRAAGDSRFHLPNCSISEKRFKPSSSVGPVE